MHKGIRAIKENKLIILLSIIIITLLLFLSALAIKDFNLEKKSSEFFSNLEKKTGVELLKNSGEKQSLFDIVAGYKLFDSHIVNGVTINKFDQVELFNGEEFISDVEFKGLLKLTLNENFRDKFYIVHITDPYKNYTKVFKLNTKNFNIKK